MLSIRSHENLEAWKLSMDLAEQCYERTKCFPRDETFGQMAQTRRAAVSIAAKIAEGYGRESTAMFIRFLRIAQGSQKELETHLLRSQRVGLMGEDVSNTLLELTDRVGRMLRNLIRALEAENAP